jgi:tRNA G18 (ribose-2'-O)-methylase SpoU
MGGACDSLVTMGPTANRESSERAQSRGTARAPGTAAPETITSRDNRWLKRFRAALAGEAPKSSAAGSAEVGIEGVRMVEAALEAARGHGGAEILAVLASESGTRHLARLATTIPTAARLLHTTDRLFEQAAGTESPQGIAALVRPRAAAFDDLVSGVPLVL